MAVETDIVVEYLNRLWENHIAGVKETSNYPALAHLFNEIGKKLQVRCIIHPRSKGAGIPDGGFFTFNQLKIALPDADRLLTQTPERGAIEVKGTNENVLAIADSGQVAKYLERYGQVLITNCYDFQLVVQDGANVKLLERFRLAESEAKFWQAARQPRALAEDKGEQLVEYLKRVMLHAAPLTRAQDVAWFLASYARDARIRIERAELAALTRVRTALEEALGMQFTGERGEHFFRSTLIQTLFYGIFSAWVLWSKTEGSNQGTSFDWRVAGWHLHVPMVSSLFSQVVNRNQLAPLDLVEVLNWTGNTLNRINREAFFTAFDEGQAVQYFYEPFLEAYDPALRQQLGVWYTPGEIIEYMVERVDRALRSELGISNGLADPNVYVLDPCCGTGGYLVAVLRRIAKTLEEQGADALTMLDVKRAATERVFGFEILPAPFVVAHLQLGLLLQQLGAPIADDKDERAAIYLTNALTGWTPVKPEKERYVQATLSGWPELREERDAAQHVKQQTPILVILGNPPYNAFAGTSPEEEGDLVQPYKQGLITEWGIKKFNLDELYARFFRLAERRIAEQTGRGIVCYISNFSYLNDPSYVVMRQRFTREFDTLWVDCLNGDSRETGKLTPEGKPDPSVFSTEFNREGIRLGTAIGLMVRQSEHEGNANVYFRQFWGVNKRAELLASLHDSDASNPYQQAIPNRENRYSFRPSNVAAHYREWPRVVDFCAEPPISGLQEMRRSALMNIDQETLARRLSEYLDKTIPWEALEKEHNGLTENAGNFIAKTARPKIQLKETFSSGNFRRYALYPFDTRWCYYSTTPLLWNRPRPNLAHQLFSGNRFFIARMVAERPNENVPIFMTATLPDYHLLRPNAVAIPLLLQSSTSKQVNAHTKQASLFSTTTQTESHFIANLSASARNYLATLGISDTDATSESAELIWMHALAIGFTPVYLKENADGVREDWPRIPLPPNARQLRISAALGKQLAELIDTEQSFNSTANPALRRIGTLTVTGENPIDLQAGALEVRAGWGHAGRDGVTMPGRGKSVERPYSQEELATFTTAGLSDEDVAVIFGTSTYDIYLNEHIYWKNIPSRVWNYRIGGYQVIKKWLSYREYTLLGRALTSEEAREVTSIARRLAAILLLEPVLNENYRKTVENVYTWGN